MATSILTSPQRIDDTFVNDMIKLIEEEHLWKEEKRYNDGTVTYTRKLPNVDQHLKAIKVITEINCSPKTLTNLLHENAIERYRDWNKSFADGRYVEKFNNDENVQWWKFSQGTLVDDRDFLVARRRVVKGEMTMIIDRSVLREYFNFLHLII